MNCDPIGTSARREFEGGRNPFSTGKNTTANGCKGIILLLDTLDQKLDNFVGDSHSFCLRGSGYQLVNKHARTEG